LKIPFDKTQRNASDSSRQTYVDAQRDKRANGMKRQGEEKEKLETRHVGL